jgi:hypothetical protein
MRGDAGALDRLCGGSRLARHRRPSIFGVNCRLPILKMRARQVGAWRRSRPQFAVSSLDPAEKSETYDIFRHPEAIVRTSFIGPRSTKSRWRSSKFIAPRASSAFPSRRTPKSLSGWTPMAGGSSKRVGSSTASLAWDAAQPQGSGLSARRAAIACMLNRLTMLTSGNEPRLAKPFARAKLKRCACADAATVPADWVMGPENPRLRGTL